MDFIKEVVEDIKEFVKNLKSSGNANVEPIINVIEPENEAVSKLYNRIKEIRYVEMEKWRIKKYTFPS